MQERKHGAAVLWWFWQSNTRVWPPAGRGTCLPAGRCGDWSPPASPAELDVGGVLGLHLVEPELTLRESLDPRGRSGARDLSPQPGDVAVGPRAVDLANAIDSQFGASSTAPAAVSLGGFSGYRLDVQLPDVNFATACDKASGQTEGSYFVWSTAEASGNDLFAQGPAQRWHLWILDVAGKRVIVVIDDFAATSAQDRAAAQAIVDSIVIEP